MRMRAADRCGHRYAVLHVPRDATIDSIRAAYRK
jgi:curved DNA-binding protein CbpA